MAAVVRRLFAALLKGDELVAQLDEGHGLASAAQLEIEEASVERQRLVDVAHFQRHMNSSPRHVPLRYQPSDTPVAVRL